MAKFSDFLPAWAARRAAEEAERDSQQRPTSAELDQMIHDEQQAIAARAAADTEAEALVMRAAGRRRATTRAEALVIKAAARLASDADEWEHKRITTVNGRRRGAGRAAGQRVGRGRPMSLPEMRSLQAKAERNGQERLASALQQAIERRECRQPAGIVERHVTRNARLTVDRG